MVVDNNKVVQVSLTELKSVVTDAIVESHSMLDERFVSMEKRFAEQTERFAAKFDQMGAELAAQSAELAAQSAKLDRIESKIDDLTEYTKLGTEILVNRYADALPESTIQKYEALVQRCQEDVQSWQSNEIQWTKRSSLDVVANILQTEGVSSFIASLDLPMLESWLLIWEAQGFPTAEARLRDIGAMWLAQWGTYFPKSQFKHTNRIMGIRNHLARRTNELLRSLFNCPGLGDSEIPGSEGSCWQELFDLLVEIDFRYHAGLQEEIEGTLRVERARVNTESVRAQRAAALRAEPWMQRVERMQAILTSEN